MALSSNIHNYSDVRRVMDAALEHGGLRYKLPTRGAAVNWRLRAYKFRQLYQAQLEENIGNLPGYKPENPYEQFVLTLDENFVVIGFRKMGEAFDAEGNPVNLESGPARSSFESTESLVEEYRNLVDPDEE